LDGFFPEKLEIFPSELRTAGERAGGHGTLGIGDDENAGINFIFFFYIFLMKIGICLLDRMIHGGDFLKLFFYGREEK